MVVPEDQPPAFFQQEGFSLTGWQACLQLIRVRYPDYAVHEATNQGGCSYTVELKSQGHIGRQPDVSIVQVRPARYALAVSVVASAKQYYGHVAPSTEEIGRLVERSESAPLIVYHMQYITGKRLDGAQCRNSRPLSPDGSAKYRNLLDDLATFYVTAWTTARGQHGPQALCTGKIGGSIICRLQTVEAGLPTRSLQSIARRVRTRVEAGVLDRLPVVFTHGDLLPSNILVDEHTWHMNGVVDWAESEFLPFGINLYGIEHLLGHMSSRDVFVYLHDATALREYFWRQLKSKIAKLRQIAVQEAVSVSRVAGILLWHGFAWDEGNIDRVVEPVRDARELAYLEAFIDSHAAVTCARL